MSLARSKEICHCLSMRGVGAASQVGTPKKVMPRMLPVIAVRELWERLPLDQYYPPEQNAEAVMPTVWAIRIGAGRGTIFYELG